MFRWGLVAAGVVILHFTFLLWSDLDPLPDDAIPTDMTDALLSIEQPGVRLVQLPAILDTAHRIYESGLTAPAYASFPPYQVQALTPTGEFDADHAHALLGSQVEVSGPLDPAAILIESIRQQQDTEPERVMGQRVLAPLAGSEGLIFALSPMLAPDDTADIAWFEIPRFKGLLCRLTDLPKNLGVPTDIDAIRKKFSSLGVYPADDALVIMTEKQPTADPTRTPRARHYIPVAGSDQTLFVFATDDQESGMDGTIVGVLEPANADVFREFERILDADLPDRIGLLRFISPDPAQQQARQMVYAGFGTATTFLGLGVWLIYLVQRRKARDLERCRRAMEKVNAEPSAPVFHTEPAESQFPI